MWLVTPDFRLDVGSLFSKSAEFPKAPDFTKTGEPTSGDSFFSTYNQQAAESIKNSIGVSSWLLVDGAVQAGRLSGRWENKNVTVYETREMQWVFTVGDGEERICLSVK